MKFCENNHPYLKMTTKEFGTTVSFSHAIVMKFCLSQQNLVTNTIN